MQYTHIVDIFDSRKKKQSLVIDENLCANRKRSRTKWLHWIRFSIFIFLPRLPSTHNGYVQSTILHWCQQTILCSVNNNSNNDRKESSLFFYSLHCCFTTTCWYCCCCRCWCIVQLVLPRRWDFLSCNHIIINEPNVRSLSWDEACLRARLLCKQISQLWSHCAWNVCSSRFACVD